jgi:septum site-determining protein MinD
LLYFHKKEKINLVGENEISVADFFIDKGDLDVSGKSGISISKYRSFDVAPSVSRVDEILKFTDLMPDSKSEAISLLDKLLSNTSKKYEFILLDSRAGYDELVAASHFVSDVTICVEEEDNISKITSDNLVNQLKEDSDNSIFRLINKASSMDLQRLKASGVEYIGSVPFDMDVMKSFGTKFFWDEISKTIYKKEIALSWNALSNKLDWNSTVDDFRLAPFGSDQIEKKLQFFLVKDRIIIVYGLIVGFAGTLYPFIDLNWISQMFDRPDSLGRFIAALTGLAGFTLSAWVLFKKRR